MRLADWMRSECIDDAGMAERVGGISASFVKKIRFRQRGASLRVAARIEEVTAGKVRPSDLLRPAQTALPLSAEARP